MSLPRKRRRNSELARCLDELGWSPRTLARRINRLAGPNCVSESGPYYWRDKGGVPHSPVPGIAAHVLSCELGRSVTAEQLWQGRADDGAPLIPSTAGTEDAWSEEGMLRVIEEWLSRGLTDRRISLAVSGSAITRLVWQFARLEPARLTAALQGDRVDDALIQQIEATIPLLRSLDDSEGGARGVAYASAQFQAVALLLHRGGHSGHVTRRLLVALGELGQTTGWMAFDSGQHGLAQRYFLTGLRAAREVGDGSLAAHILGDMSYQAACRGIGKDAVEMGEAAVQVASGATRTAQASVITRLGYGYAVAGNHDGFTRARARAREMFEEHFPGQDPAWAYYLSNSHLDAQAGYSLVHMGRAQLQAGNRVAARKLLARGTTLLASYGIVSEDDPFQRHALFEGTWLTIGLTAQGELEHACATARLAISRLTRVRSPRCMELLATLRADFSRGRHNSPCVRELLPELDAALRRYVA